MTFIFVLLLTPGLTHCFSVTAKQGMSFLVYVILMMKKFLWDISDPYCLINVTGGKTSPQLFFCTIPGCAADVAYVFCNEKRLFSRTRIADCTGPPPPNTLCQHDGRAFVSTDRDGACEFEGEDRFIDTTKCTGISFCFLKPLMYCTLSHSCNHSHHSWNFIFWFDGPQSNRFHRVSSHALQCPWPNWSLE